MHAISHTLAHRAPPASRTRARWQPYNSLSTYTALSGPSSSKSSSPVSESTPATSVFSSSQPITACDSSAIQSALQNPTVTSTEPSKDATSSKNKLALGLVGTCSARFPCRSCGLSSYDADQAVKTLCEVWRPQDIPPVFSNPRTTRQTQSLPNFSPQTQLLESNSRNRLPSKAQQTTTASTSIPTSHTIPAATATPALIQPCTSSELRNLVPIRGFVHEVLRRSRTSGCVLQTALCYLEAIRPKIAEYAHLERIGKGTNGEPETAPRIVVATQEEIERSRMEEEQELSMSESAPTTIRISGDDSQGDAMDTVRVEMDEDTYLVSPDESSMTQDRSSSSPLAMDSSSNIEETESTYNSSSTTSTSPSRPIGHLPTPLLCPRRAFLAALILASKFTQDKCYSNRAWAKLSGLPPKEIGRCERALGCALEWRLWVGKANAATSTPTQSSSSPTSAHRPVVRCQSESSLNMTVPTTSDLINPYPVGESSASMLETPIRGVALVESDRVSGPRRTIKRAATLPSNVMTAALNGSSVPNLCEASFVPLGCRAAGRLMGSASRFRRQHTSTIVSCPRGPAARWVHPRRRSLLSSNCKSQAQISRLRPFAALQAQICQI